MTGWIITSSEIYGQPSQQHAFCSSTCVSAAALEASENPTSAFYVPEAPASEIPVPVAPDEIVPG
jgi:hypothetical protein